MSTRNAKPPIRNTWMIALLVSIGVNGLLFGLLLSKQAKPDAPTIEAPNVANSTRVLSTEPRRFIRALPPERRKQVLTAAYNNVDLRDGDRPRQLFRKLRRTQKQTRKLIKADDFDLKAIEKSLGETRELKHKLAISGDAMIIEVLNQLSAQERKDAIQTMRTRHELRRQRHQRRRRQ
ncbi:MAG: periplasmic heavy metal sensor [Robiginitomaculum sp.]|nr:periplasmic heavy metal sensor [Robiginitomaculum sp.]